MNFIDFKNKEIKDYKKDYHTERIRLQIEPMMNYKFSKFVDVLTESIVTTIHNRGIESIDKPILFDFYTDIEDYDLEISRDSILSALTEALIINKTFKNGEKILGIPDGLLEVDILSAYLMDLVNYPLRAERFFVRFFDKEDNLINEII